MNVISGFFKDSSAETARFELAIQFPVYTLSRRAPSTTRTRLPEGGKNNLFSLNARIISLRFP